jgi:hypothetical protein
MATPVITHENVRLAIQNEIVEFAQKRNLTPAEINQGMCAVFAENVLYELGVADPWPGTEFQIMNIEMLQVRPRRNEDAEDWMGLPFNQAKITEQWPGTFPPKGMSWDDMDAVSAHALLDGSTHTWFRFQDRHYDCETPDGCLNIFDMPLFKYHIDRWVEAGRPTPVEQDDYSRSPGS